MVFKGKQRVSLMEKTPGCIHSDGRGVATECNGQFQCLAKFLLKHEKQNPSPQLKRTYQK